MGFGVTGPLAWLLGAFAMIVIWGGVWWGLSVLVFHWPTRELSRRRRSQQPSQDSARWQQPTFDPVGSGPETGLRSPPGSQRSKPPIRHQSQTHPHTEGDNR